MVQRVDRPPRPPGGLACDWESAEVQPLITPITRITPITPYGAHHMLVSDRRALPADSLATGSQRRYKPYLRILVYSVIYHSG